MTFKPPDPHDDRPAHDPAPSSSREVIARDHRTDPRLRGSALAMMLGVALAGGCTGDAEPAARTEQAVIGACTRDIPALRATAPGCTIDAQCACGSFCDTVEHQCTFTCMVPPGKPTEACTTGTQCDDTGRCVGPNPSPPANTPTLATLPAALTTVVGGAPATLQVQLAVYTGGAALLAAAVTPVRVVGGDGAAVSCDGGASFVDECELISWTFQFDGARYNASKAVLVRTPAGTALGHGQVHLRIDASDSDTIVPVSAAVAAPSAPDGDYHGTATTPLVPAGLPVSARIVGHTILVRDPTYTLAPSGGFVMDMYTPSNPTPADSPIPWLRAPGATPTPYNAMPASYGALTYSYDAATGTLSGFTYFTVLDSYTLWRLNLVRDPQAAPSCAADTDCTSGQVCWSAVHACVPSDAVSGSTPYNGFADDRLAQWWTQLQSTLGTGDVASGSSIPAFATSDADMIESLMCTTSSGGGRLGVRQVEQGTGPSHSGDLGCVTDAGAASLAPGAIGLATYVDRNGAAPSAALLNTCLTDLARAPTASIAANFAPTTGACVNLARALPALRLLATGELDKRTALNPEGRSDPRLQALFFRLLQQWTQLHGFIASTGLAERAFEDATTSTPADARQALLSLLDVLDEGWALLLDGHLASAVQEQAGSESGSDSDVFGPLLDYRAAKQPMAYWTFNHGANASRDLIQGLALTTQQPACHTLLCRGPSASCLIQTTRDSFSNAWNCPGEAAHLTPAPGAPSISDGGNLTVTFNIDPLDAEIAPYGGGTIFASSTLAVVETRDATGPTLNVIHPTAGGPEWVPFRLGELGHWTGGTTGGDGPPKGTSVAIVRDSLRHLYTVYVFNAEAVDGVQSFTRGYSGTVSGALPQVPANTVMIGAGPWAGTGMWATGTPALRSSYAARIDDVAIWSSMLSKREFVRFANARQYVETHRDVWPQDLVVADYATQELKTPVATSALDALSAHLDLADRLAVHMRYEAQAACDSHDPAARADIDTIVARLGRTLRQSLAVKALIGKGDADTTNQDRVLVGAKTSQLIRDLTTLTACRNPYGMGDHEVPLYFGGIAPNTDEKAAFFAASDHLLTLAEQRTQTAQVALDTVRTRWDQARQSQIQQLQDDAQRATRVDELQTKYGETLIRLCGIADRTPQQILADVDAGTFSIDSCFVQPPSGPPANTCPTSNTSGPVMDADPTCYRGALGGALTDTRSAYYAQQAAYQAWQAAINNSKAANKLCVLKEMDVFGCSAVDRNALTGVTCPPGFEGTIQLTREFNAEMVKDEQTKSWLDLAIHVASTIAAVATTVVTTGPGAAFLVASAGALQPVSTEMGTSMEDRRRAHEATVQARSLTEDVRQCWATADQYERAIAAAEQASLEASSRMQSAVITFENGVAEGNEVLAVAPQEIDRELNRPSIPIAFHYWLPEALETYQLACDSARRYTYMALRATEYDMLESYATPRAGKPSRATVLGAWLPTTLSNQLAMMRDQTNTRQTLHGPPRLGHMVFDLGAKFFGLPESSGDFGTTLLQYAQPVYSEHGENLGLGVRFSLVPNAQDESPTWRCAERIWRVNIGASALPFSADGTHVKLLKRNVFASRTCDGDGFQVATLRPGTNLLVGAGDATAYVAENTSSVADVSLADFDQPDALLNFKTRDDFLNGSSSELALQELYGDYVLLFPASTLAAGLALDVLHDFYLRFDFLSIDNTPPIAAVLPKRPTNASPGPIVLQTGLSTEGAK